MGNQESDSKEIEEPTSLSVCRKAVGVIKTAIIRSQSNAALFVNQEQLALYNVLDGVNPNSVV